MSCSPFDLRDYFFQELPDPQQRLVEAHLKTCQQCHEEVDRFKLTETALFALRDEEIPQRVAFVSDPVFEPSPLRRFLGSFWNSTARLGFASAAMLSIALVVFALRPSATVVVQAPAPAPQTVQTVSAADIQSRIDAAVSQAVAQAEARQAEQTRRLVSDVQATQRQLRWAADELQIAEKRNKYRTLSASNLTLPPLPNEEGVKQ